MYKYLLLCILMLFLFSCENESNTYEVGSSWTSAQSKMVMIDTLTMKMSTIIMDSVTTSGKNVMLIGNIKDQTFGKVTSSSLFELTPSTYGITSPSSAVFDSIVMYLTNTDFYYGDTLKSFKLNAYPLQDRIKLNNGYLYNKSNFNYSPNSVGSAEFYPRPGTDSSYVKMRLDQSYGLSIFNTLKNNDVATQENFLNFFKGLALVPSSDNNAMMRFKMNSTYEIQINKSTKEKVSNTVRLYYHTTSQNGTELLKYTLDLKPSSTYSYNKIGYDFSGSELANLTPKTPIPSQNLGNKTYLMAGIGVFTKVEVPYLKSLKNLYQNYKVIDATLSLSPVAGYYSNSFYNPGALYYYWGDKLNHVVGSYSQSDGSSEITASLSNASEFQNEHSYDFSFKTYVNTILSESADSNYNTLIYPSSYTDVLSGKVVFGDQKNKTNPAKLKVYMLGY
ncbi:DUF4270 family protein [Chryseobacterium geocarposphaerae]|uniref:Uncharacterized protein DUF4270 n=1 Tax=Chryseobacterium geocarposphaerae TaxID=1416776 RepID=A0A2M9CA89_9FLAO|nr:DUF4270 family protein [Chryseobacterium geocarposphaerae]PJJ67745.1 uncharacterized protein DUF4270 [Chryseobacterium geocarposphaerae]